MRLSMKVYINKILALVVACVLLASCDDDETLTVLQKVNFTAAPQVSADEVVITEENKIETLLQVSWNAVVFPVEGPVTYTVEFETPNDTSGANGWADAV